MKYQTDKRRVFGLDILRALAILFVLFAHGKLYLTNTFLKGFPYIIFIDGVTLFFVLSGFLIGNILLKEINKNEKFRIKDLFKFWKRRWFRTLPNYYLILFVNIILIKLNLVNLTMEHFSRHFFIFTHNFSSPFAPFFLESWSLSVEEWFYIFAPTLIFISLMFLNKKTAFLSATLLMMIVPLLYRMAIYDPSATLEIWDVAFRKVVLTRLDSISYGLLAAWIFYYYKHLWNKVIYFSLIVGIILIGYMNIYPTPFKFFYMQTFYFSLASFSLMLFIPFFESIKSAKGKIPYFIEYISKISYSMYLVNLSIISFLILHNFYPKNTFDAIFKYFLFWILVFITASILYKYFEKPMMQLRDKKFNLKKIINFFSFKKNKIIQ